MEGDPYVRHLRDPFRVANDEAQPVLARNEIEIGFEGAGGIYGDVFEIQGHGVLRIRPALEPVAEGSGRVRCGVLASKGRERQA